MEDLKKVNLVLAASSTKPMLSILTGIATIVAEWDDCGVVEQGRHGGDYIDRIAQIMRGEKPLWRPVR